MTTEIKYHTKEDALVEVIQDGNKLALRFSTMTTIKYHSKEEALAEVIQDGNELAFCTSELKNNEDVVMAAIKQNSWYFRCASDELKSNKDFILKALHASIAPDGLIAESNVIIQSDIEVISLALEKSKDGWEFQYSKGEVALNKELAAKALVKWGNYANKENLEVWEDLHPTIQEFFPKDSWYEKAQDYLHHLEQPKNVLGGSTEEDDIVW